MGTLIVYVLMLMAIAIIKGYSFIQQTLCRYIYIYHRLLEEVGDLLTYTQDNIQA